MTVAFARKLKDMTRHVYRVGLGKLQLKAMAPGDRRLSFIVYTISHQAAADFKYLDECDVNYRFCAKCTV